MRRKILSALLIAALMLMSLSIVSAQDEEVDPLGIRDDDSYSWEDLDMFADMEFEEGAEVYIFGAFTGPDKEKFDNVLAYFNAVTGLNARYEGSGDFESQIIINTQGGNPPDIAMFPQPGLMREFAGEGNLVPIPDDLSDYIAENYGDAWFELGTAAGPDGEDDLYVLYYNVNMKSLVWYLPERFEDFGYEVPETWDEMIELSETMIEDGNTPWCIGVESSGATGWAATDWVEDIMLRMYTPDVYDAWVAHEIPFNDERVVAAIEEFGRFIQDGWVFGGPENVVNTPFGDAPDPMFNGDCMMHRQASFITAYFPEDVEVGEDVTAFYLPPMDPELTGNPVLGAGNLTAIMQDPDLAEGEVSAEVMAVMEFLTMPLAHELWATQGDFLTPHGLVNPDTFATDVQLTQNEFIQNADVFRFDGSDTMPSAVGNGTFWTGMVDFINGTPAQEVADAIEESWPME